MKVFFDDCKVPIKSWCENPEDGCIQQAKNLANLPFVFKHVALMPDTHQGYGMPIGGVLATEGVIIPNAVGVDIGCGMRAVRITLKEISTEQLKDIMSIIRDKIPLGFNKHKEPQCQDFELFSLTDIEDSELVKFEVNNTLKQLGTLGGGNHFIEIQKGSDGFIWFMIHSGSRNLGKQVCDYYNKIAKDLNKKWHTSVPEDSDLAFLPLDSKEGRAYQHEMQMCLEFAYKNREKMSEHIKYAFKKVIALDWTEPDYCHFVEEYDIHHNYATIENHFGKNVVVHRKGATSAKKGQIGLIPGSQGTSSYVVKGKGNRESFMSCSHGAGRKLGRKAACKTLNLEEEIKLLNDKGIIHAIRNQDDLEEAAGAYKPIDVVMKEQEDLVEILVKLEPLAVIKG